MLIEKTKRTKKTHRLTRVVGRFSMDTKAVQAEVEALNLSPPRRKDGTVSLDGDWLKENVPTDHEPLQALLSYEKLQKILRTYLDLYSQTGVVYPRINTLGPRSGRRSASRPNIQNVPKRKWGIRGLFIPRPGHYFIRCDYTAQELLTLAQAMIDLGIGKGPLWECVTSDLDPHILGATKTLGKYYDDIDKNDRQGQKVVAFGVPGGLGPASLKDYAYATFGVKWTLGEARAARRRFLEAFWDVDEYLKAIKPKERDILETQTGRTSQEWADALEFYGWNVVRALCEHEDPDFRLVGENAARAVAGRLRTGRQRSKARFTEIANTHFQGLASDVTKHAEWLMFKEFGWPPTIVCHDEIVMEFPYPYDGGLEWQEKSNHEDQLWQKEKMEELMKQAFVEVCPDVGPYAKAEGEILTKWGADTDKDGEEIE